jgi:hypothetical protein
MSPVHLPREARFHAFVGKQGEIRELRILEKQQMTLRLFQTHQKGAVCLRRTAGGGNSNQVAFLGSGRFNQHAPATRAAEQVRTVTCCAVS